MEGESGDAKSIEGSVKELELVKQALHQLLSKTGVHKKVTLMTKQACKRVAVYAASGLGDGVLAAQLARQLCEQGHHLTLYSSV